MLDFLVPYLYFWPWIFVVTVLCLSVLFVVNVMLGVFCVGLYYLVPEEVWDSFFDSLHNWIRNKFSYYFEKIESNLQQTFQLHIEKEIPQKSILIWQPHGLMTITSSIYNAFRIPHTNYSPTKLVSLNFYHTIPILRDIMRIAHVTSSDYENIKNTLQTESISIMLGGVKELLNSDENKIYLVIKDRKGIFKLALESGSPIVPVITYGENKLFKPIHNSVIDTINSYLYSLFRIGVPIPTLDSLKNWCLLYKGPLEPIHTYIGSSIDVKKIEHPTDSDIQTLKSKYITEIQTLFTKTNPGNYQLIIL